MTVQQRLIDGPTRVERSPQGHRLSGPAEIYYLIEQQFPSTGFTIPFAFRVSGRLDPGLLREAVRLLAKRHESLRTRVIRTPEGPRQIPDPEPQEMLTVIDAAPDAADEYLEEQFTRPFRPATEHPLRVLAIRVRPDEWVIGFQLHHLAADGWTLTVLMHELGRRYGELAAGLSPEVRTDGLQQIDYADWVREALAHNAFADEIAYWSEALAGNPGQPLAPATPFAGIPQPGRIAYLRAPLPGELAAMCARRRLTPYPVLFAVLAAVLAGETGRTDFSVNSAMDNRMYPGLEETAGYLANMIPLRARLDPLLRDRTAGFDALLDQAADTCMNGFQYQQMPYTDLAPHAETGVGNGRPSLMFQYFAEPPAAPELAGCATAAITEDAARRRFLTSPTGLRITVTRSGHGFTAEFAWQPELWTTEYMSRLLARYTAALQAVCDDASVPLRQLLDPQQMR